MKLISIIIVAIASLLPWQQVAAEHDTVWLNIGARGNEVQEIQQTLYSFGFVLEVDGYYGPRTERVVRAFQRFNGLLEDGIVGPVTRAALNRAATAQAGATRGEAQRVGPASVPPPAPAAPVGLHGKPFAPAGLSNCDEMNFYRVQWGLPDRFAQLGWRESNCRNEDAVRTFCCFGYLQLYVSLHLRDHRIAPLYRECGVTSHHDINSDTPLEKQKHMCAAAALFSVVGYQAWAL